MTTLHEAARLALEALNKCIGRHYDLAEDASIGDAIEALKALAQQGEQPVAEVREQQYCIAPSEVKYSRTVIEMLDGVSLPHGTLLYAGDAPAAQPEGEQK